MAALPRLPTTVVGSDATPRWLWAVDTKSFHVERPEVVARRARLVRAERESP